MGYKLTITPGVSEVESLPATVPLSLMVEEIVPPAPPPPPPPPPQPEPSWRTVWAPDNAFIAAKFGSGIITAPATKYRAKLGTAPDGAEAVEIQAYGGEPNDLCQYKHYLPDGGVIESDVVRVSAEGWLEEGYAFNRGPGKYPCGVWIGDQPSGGGIGAPHVIATHTPGRAQPGLNIGTLNLGHVYGPGMTDASGTPVDVPLGRWFKLVMTVSVNALGQTDGWIKFELFAGGARLGESFRDGLVFRDAAIRGFGPYLIEMWGGSPLDGPGIMPPKDQKSWWRNWRFEVPIK